MKVRYLIQESAQALRINTLRSILTVTGIVVGIFAVTAMLALGEGLSQSINERISQFSQGDVSVQGTFSQEDLTWIEDQPYVKTALGAVSVSSQDVLIFGEDYNVGVSSMLGDFNTIQQPTLREGELYDFADPNFNGAVTVVTSTLDDAVREKSGEGLLHQYLTIGGQRYESSVSSRCQLSASPGTMGPRTCPTVRLSARLQVRAISHPYP